MDINRDSLRIGILDPLWNLQRRGGFDNRQGYFSQFQIWPLTTRPFIWIIMSPNFGGVASVDAQQEGFVNFLGEQFAELQPPPKEILEGNAGN